MAADWWPNTSVVTAIAKRVGITGRIAVSIHQTAKGTVAGEYCGLVDGVHRINLYRASEDTLLQTCIGIISICHEIIHVSQAEQLGHDEYFARSDSEAEQAGNRCDGPLERQAYALGEELAASYLLAGVRAVSDETSTEEESQ